MINNSSLWIYQLAIAWSLFLLQFIFEPIHICLYNCFYFVEGDHLWIASSTLLFLLWLFQTSNSFQKWMVLTGWVSTLLLWGVQHWIWFYLLIETLNFITYIYLSAYKQSQSALLFYLWLNTLISFFILILITQEIIISSFTWHIQIQHWCWVAVLSFKIGWFPFQVWMTPFYQSLPNKALLWIMTFPKLPYLGWIEHQQIFHLSLWYIVLFLSWCYVFVMVASQYQPLGFFTISTFWNSSILGWLALNQSSLAYLIVYISMTWLFIWGILIYKETRLSTLFIWIILASLPPFQSFFIKLWIFHSFIQDYYIFVTLVFILILVRSVSYYLKWSQQNNIHWKPNYYKKIGFSISFIYLLESILLSGWF